MCRNESCEWVSECAVSVQLVVKYKTQNIWLFLVSLSALRVMRWWVFIVYTRSFPFLYVVRFHFHFISLSFALSLFLHHPPFVHSFHQDWHKHTYCVCLFAVTMLLPLANAAFNPLQQRQHLRHIHLLPLQSSTAPIYSTNMEKYMVHFSCWNLFHHSLLYLSRFRSLVYTHIYLSNAKIYLFLLPFQSLISHYTYHFWISHHHFFPLFTRCVCVFGF